MRILYVTVLNLGAHSGAVEHAEGILTGLAGLGHEVSRVALGEPTMMSPAATPVVAQGSWPRNIRRLRWAVESATSGSDKPDIVYVRSFPLDYMLVLRRLTKLKIPFVLELNVKMKQEYRAEGKRRRGALYALAERSALASSAGWLGVTHEILEDASRRVPASPPSVIAPNGFFPGSVERLPPSANARLELGVDSATRVVVMTSFERPWHGADRALAMLQYLPSNVELWLVGAHSPTKSEASLRVTAPTLASRVRFWRWLSGEDFARVLSAADVGLGPLALDRKDMEEAQPMKVRTYLGAGVPVLQNYLDPALESAGRFVKYVHSKDPALLAEGVISMLQLPSTERNNAAAFARQNLTWEAAARSTALFLEEVLLGIDTAGRRG